MTDRDCTSSTESLQTQALAPKPRAHVFFWAVLAAATTVSVTGNATQAVLHSTAVPVVAAAVAVIPPLALLAAVHGVTLLARAHAAARSTHLVAITMTVVIATGAFWLSFTALRSLAVTAGVPHSEAWLWPLIIEGSMTQCTIALLALAHSTHNKQRAHAADHRTEVSSEQTNASIADTDITAPVARAVAEPARPRTAAPQDFSDLAARLCARDPARRRDPELVTRVLAHHHVDGWTPTQIANELRKSRSTVSRILSDAASLSAHQTPRDEDGRDGDGAVRALPAQPQPAGVIAPRSQ